MRISDWSSDVCSSDLISPEDGWHIASIRPMALSDLKPEQEEFFELALETYTRSSWRTPKAKPAAKYSLAILHNPADALPPSDKRTLQKFRSEEHTSELQSLMRISYAVFCLKKKK